MGDVVPLICQLKQSTFDLLLQKHIKVKASKLHGLATRLCSFAQNWQKEADKKKPDAKKVKNWRSKTQADFNTFFKELENQMKAGNLDEQAIREIVNLRDQIGQIF